MQRSAVQNKVVPNAQLASEPAGRASWMHGGKAEHCFATNERIDIKQAVILDVDAVTTAFIRRFFEDEISSPATWPHRL
ncbi:MAG: hypothetical protein NVS3B5_04840 [Sphingomicrobium sp.]